MTYKLPKNSFDGNQRAKRTGNGVYASIPTMPTTSPTSMPNVAANQQNIKTNFQGARNPLALNPFAPNVESGMNPSNAYVPQKQNMFGNNFAVDSDRGYQPLGDYKMKAGDGGFNWFGEDGVLEPGAKALFGGLGALMDYQQLGLNKDAAKFKKGMDITNLFNQAQTSNFNLTQHAEDEAIGQGLTGDAKAAYVSNKVKKHGVKGSF